MSSSIIHYNKHSDLKVRPLPEWGNLLLFTPARPQLHWLNLNAWVIFELCDGRDEDNLRTAYFEMVRSRLSPEEAERHLQSGLALLQTIGAVKQETQERRS